MAVPFPSLAQSAVAVSISRPSDFSRTHHERGIVVLSNTPDRGEWVAVIGEWGGGGGGGIEGRC